MFFYNLDAKKICIENPIPSKIFNLPKYDQIINPYDFGSIYRKKTCLWLKNLPVLLPTHIPEKIINYIGAKKGENYLNTRSSKIRSKSFNEISLAMVKQWS